MGQPACCQRGAWLGLAPAPLLSHPRGVLAERMGQGLGKGRGAEPVPSLMTVRPGEVVVVVSWPPHWCVACVRNSAAVPTVLASVTWTQNQWPKAGLHVGVSPSWGSDSIRACSSWEFLYLEPGAQGQGWLSLLPP